MNNGSSKKDSGGIEVVADQADDGSYELRFEKQRKPISDETAHTPSAGIERPAMSGELGGASAEVDTGAWRARDVDTAAPGVSPAWPRFAMGGAILALLLFGVIALTTLGQDRQPTTVEVAEPAFQGVFVDTPPLVIDEMVIVEEAGDATDDATPEDAVQTRPSNAAAVRIPSTGQRTRGLTEPVIDDVVRSALENVAREDSRQREVEERRAAQERREAAERIERDRRSQQQVNMRQAARQASEEPVADEYYEDDEYYDEDEPYEDDEYYDEEYPVEGDADLPRDEDPLDEPY